MIPKGPAFDIDCRQRDRLAPDIMWSAAQSDATSVGRYCIMKYVLSRRVSNNSWHRRIAILLLLLTILIPGRTTAAEAINLLPIGCSITQTGIYVTPLMAKLADNGYAATLIANEGRGGFTVDMLQANIKTYMNHPNVNAENTFILLMVGANDVMYHLEGKEDITTAPARLGKLVATIREIAPLARVIVAQFSPDTAPGFDAPLRKFNQDIVPVVARFGPKVSIVDLYTPFQPNPSIYLNETVHPNRMGGERMADAWFRAIVAASRPKGSGDAQCRVIRLRCEHLQNPIGIDTNKPRLSWELQSEHRGRRQTAYQILVASSSESLAKDHGNLWNSGKVVSDASSLVEYAGSPLESGTPCYWKVRVWDENDAPTAWSLPAQFTIGLLAANDWKGRWTGMASAGDHDEPWFRKTFQLKQKPQSAVIYVGSIGYHELYVNGKKVGDRVLCPSVSDLTKRALYVAYDVADYLQPGDNVIAVWLAPGWSLFRGVNPGTDFQFSKSPLLIAQLDVRDGEKRCTLLATDRAWKCHLSREKHLGEWTYTNFGGDRIDASRDIPGWNNVGLDDSKWENVTIYELTRALSADLVQPNRKRETMHAVGVTQIGPRKYRVDMGRCYAGWVEAKLKGRPGSTVAISLSYNGQIECQYNQRNEYVLDATGAGTFCNHFAYHGCRYVTIDGVDTPPSIADIVGHRIGNDLERTGSFDCSNKLLKKIYDADINTMLNLTTGGVMVDCPHRERLGYGDTCQTSIEAMAAAVDAAAFYSKWARDWRDIQHDNGYVGHTAPTRDGGGGPCWSGSVMMIPWSLYQLYGDRHALAESYPPMKRWLQFLGTKCDATGLLVPFTPPTGTKFQQWCFIGDWVTPHGSELSDSVEALYFNNCYYLLATRTACQIARALGLDQDVQDYEMRADRIKNALNKRFFNASQNIYLDTRQSHAAMALVSGAVPSDALATVMANLRNEILAGQKGHLDVGDPVIYYMTKYLTDQGANDLVFTYMNQTTYPGYGFFIDKGLDTLPETWDFQGPDSSVIHGCFTGIGGWFVRGIGGIRPDPATPGYKHFLLKPAIVGDLTWADTTCSSPYGPIGCRWSLEKNRLVIKAGIPANMTATVHVPAKDVSAVTESGEPADKAVGVAFLRMENGCAVFHVQSGTYEFASSASKP